MKRAGFEAEEIARRSSRLEELLAGTSSTDVAVAALDENVFEGALTSLQDEFTDQPLVRARLQQTLLSGRRAKSKVYNHPLVTQWGVHKRSRRPESRRSSVGGDR